MIHLPNIITIFRLLSVPVIAFLILRDETGAAFWLLVLSSLSDGADGYLARRFKVESVLGKYLDPIADKILLITLFLILGFLGEASPLLVALVISRDLLILGGVFYLRHQLGDELGSPIWMSKLHTSLQMCFVSLVLLKRGQYLEIPTLITGLSYGFLITTIFSSWEYLRIARSLLKRSSDS